MLITIIAVIIALGYFFYPPKFGWVRASVKYLIGIFCFWTAIIFAKPEVQESIWRPAGFFILLIAGLLLLADFLTAVFLWISEKLSSIFMKAPKLPEYLMEIWSAFERLAARKVGALIVLQRKQPLRPQMKGGMPFDAEIRSEILIPLFLTSSPVHDGALIVQKERVQTVKGILPLAALSDLAPNFGTRHRAAIGITEKTDAVALVVSEERGQVSVACHGCLVKIDGKDEFIRVMNWILKGKNLLKLKNVNFVVTTKVLNDLA